MDINPEKIIITFTSVFIISFMKGAFGGGFAIIGIPLLSLVMDPIEAGGFLAPLFIIMDIIGLKYWKPSTWSKTDIKILIPSLIFGIGAGFYLFRILNHNLISIIMAMITLTFVMLWLFSRHKTITRKRSRPRAIAAGITSGITTMVAHSGGPPLALYLLPLGLSKQIYAGTTSIFFSVGNLLKALPWIYLAKPTDHFLYLMGITIPAIPLGIWCGWILHERLNQKQMVAACYVLLTIVSIKLLYDGVEGYLI